MPPVGSDGEILSTEEMIRDSGPIASGEVVEVRMNRACVSEDSCGELPTMIFRVDKMYKGFVEPVFEFYPIELCGFEVHLGDRMVLSPDPAGDLSEMLGIKAPYVVAGGVGGWQPELDKIRNHRLDLEARAAERLDDPAGWQELASFMEEWRDYERALKAYDRLARLLPKDLDIQAKRGRLLFYLRMPEAELVLSRVVAARPSDRLSRSLLAILQYESGDSPSMTGLDLRNTDLRDRAFENMDFSGTDFSGADLRRIQLKNVKLDEVDLRGALLTVGPPGSRIEAVTLRRANLSNHYIGDQTYGIVHLLAMATDVRGAKLSGVDVPVGYLGGDGPSSLSRADLSGARIVCDATPDAAWWRIANVDYRRQHWQDYLDDLKLAQRIVDEQPAALLDASCSDAIRDVLHEDCAPWIAKANRPAACKIDF
jgi:uncharacterized protein YjbI with pentapeptide repeats